MFILKYSAVSVSINSNGELWQFLSNYNILYLNKSEVLFEDPIQISGPLVDVAVQPSRQAQVSVSVNENLEYIGFRRLAQFRGK